MTDSLTSLLVKNIDLILEAFNVDEKGNLVPVNRQKVAETDELFHNYFVKRMNNMFRQINEADPIMHGPNMMDPMGQQGMHQMGHGMDDGMGMDPMGHPGMGEPGADDMLGDMAMDDMHMGQGGMGQGGMDQGMDGMDQGMDGMDMDGQHGMGGPPMGGAPAMESTDFDWMNEDIDLNIDSLFNLSEDEDEDDEDEDEDPDDQLNEFGMGGMGMGMDDEDDMSGHMGGSMGMNGGHTDFGGDMGGMGHDDGMMGGMDHGMGHDDGMGGMGHDDGMMGGDDEMVTIHGTTDSGGEFEFSFDPDTLGFGDEDGGGDMGHSGHDDMGDDSGFGGHEGGDEGGEEPSFGGESEHEDDDHPVAEAAGRKPGKGRRGPKTPRMGVVPTNPASSHAAPFPTPQGSRQKRK